MSRPTMYWQELLLPPVVAPASARAVLVGLASLAGQPRLVLEAVATGGAIRWRVGTDDDVVLRRVCHVIRTHLPETDTMAPDTEWPSLDGPHLIAGQIRVPGSRTWPFANLDTAAVTRGLLATLATAGRGEVLGLQLVLGVRTPPARTPEPSRSGGSTRELSTRHSQYGFGCALRIAARSGSSARAHALVSSVAASLKGLDAPRARTRLTKIAGRSVVRASSPFVWPLWLSVDDLVPVTAWPVSPDPAAQLPGLPPRHPKLLRLTSAHPDLGVVIGDGTIGNSQDDGWRRPMAQAPADALRHRHVLGPTGVGKSTLLAGMALQDIQAGRGVVVVDPKGDLVADLLARVPAERTDDVVVLDAASPHPLGLNPLGGDDPDSAADGVVAVFHSLYGDGLGPRSTDLLHGACLTLARRGDGSLPMVPLLLTHAGFRRSVIGRMAREDPLGLGAFWASFEAMSDGERDNAVRPLLNKLRPLMLRPSLRAVFGQRSPAISLDEVLAKDKVLLVRLGKDRIGAEAAQLLGSLLVAQLWQATLGRGRLPTHERHPVMVTIDEVQDYLRLPGSLGDALAQARGFGVGITAAHQHRGQLGRLLEDIDANTSTKIFFRLAPADAHAVVRSSAAGVLEAADFTEQRAFAAYARLLTDGELAPWVSIRTRPLPSATRDPIALQRRSEVRYGRALSDVEADLLALVDGRPAAHRPSDRTTDGPLDEATHTSLGRRRPAPERAASNGATPGAQRPGTSPTQHMKGGQQ